MSDQIELTNMSEEIWRAVIAELEIAGWSLQIGGGLDFCWALLSREGMQIDMEYDIWMGGEMIFAVNHASRIKADLSAKVVAELEPW